VKETLLTLLKLAEIDSKIFQILEDKETIPDIINDAQEEITSLKTESTEFQTELDELTAQKKEYDEFIVEKTEWAAQRETNINELKTHKEFQAAQREITLARKEIKDKTEALTTISTRMEELNSLLETAKEKSLPRIEELEALIAEKNDKLTMADSAINDENNNRTEILSQLTDKGTLRHYDSIRKKVAPAMSKLEGINCNECGQKVMPQIINLLKIGKTMQLCRGCKRILYIEETLFS